MDRAKVKPPGFPRWIFSHFASSQEKMTVVGDLDEYFFEIVDEKGKNRAIMWYWGQVLKSLPLIIKHTIYRSYIMFRNYLKISLRNLQRNKGFSVINILGLSIGIASCLLILLYVRFESNYDTHHKDHERIYRVALSSKSGASEQLYASIPNKHALVFKDVYPELEEVVRFGKQSSMQAVKYRDKHFYESDVMIMDQSGLEVFNIPFVNGDPSTALLRPFTAILTEEFALKYFGNENPIGKIISLDTTGYEITGVVKKPPTNTLLKFDMIVSFDSIDDHRRNNWFCPVYIKLRGEADVEVFENKIKAFPRDYAETEEDRNTEDTLFLQPLKDIHLSSNLIWEPHPPGNPMYVYIFMVVGVFIMMIAGMNYMNLSTARSMNRSGEVGLRKVVGAHRKQLIIQFMGESLLLTFIATVFAFLLLALSLNFFNSIGETEFRIADLLQSDIIAGSIVIFILIGFVSGSYPALFLSAFKPVSVLKGGNIKGMKGTLVRKALVVGQFAISITLIIGTLIIFKQLDYMKNMSLGFNKEQKIVVSFLGNATIGANYQNVKDEFLQHPSILGATAASNVLGRWQIRWQVWPSGQREERGQTVNFLMIDRDFLSEYEIEIIEGMGFAREPNINQPDGFLINEAAIGAFGWNSPQEAIGKGLWDRDSEIIGIMKNFHFSGVQSAIEPYVLLLSNEQFRYITLRIDTENLSETVSFIENKYSELFQNQPIDYFFLDEDFDKQYRSEERTANIFTMFTILGLFIACLGLFGLASFMAQQRTKEIGIRKILGASSNSVIILLIKEFVRLVGLGIVISWPLAYFSMSIWLQNFAYRISPGWISFIAAAFMALTIAVLTVIYQSYRAAS
ncbi:MAG: FtsX-like permease family protein, partial [bacterium]|nr:FtsX-like permease family protein [bacterium]